MLFSPFNDRRCTIFYLSKANLFASFIFFPLLSSWNVHAGFLLLLTTSCHGGKYGQQQTDEINSLLKCCLLINNTGFLGLYISIWASWGMFLFITSLPWVCTTAKLRNGLLRTAVNSQSSWVEEEERGAARFPRGTGEVVCCCWIPC